MNLVTREHAQEDARLRQSIVAHLLGIENERDDTLTARSQCGGRYLCLHIRRKVHHHRRNALGGGIPHVDLLNGTVTTVDVIKLHIVAVNIQIGYREGILSGEINDFLHHHSTNLKVERLLGGITIEGNVLKEMSHLTGVVSGIDHERLTRGYLSFGIFHRRTSARGSHILDNQGIGTHVLEFKLGGNWLFVDHTTTIDYLILSRNLLSMDI